MTDVDTGLPTVANVDSSPPLSASVVLGGGESLAVGVPTVQTVVVDRPQNMVVTVNPGTPGARGPIGVIADGTYVLANPALSISYSPDGTINFIVEDGVITSFTYYGDGSVKSKTIAGNTRTFTYDSFGNLIGGI
jgi:hypothetical protein